MAIVRWTPARDLLTLRDAMDRLVDTTWGGQVSGWSAPAAVAFPMDVYQTEKEYVVKASLPGVKAEDLDVSIVGETLTIKAEAKEEKDVKEEGWLLKEHRYNSFCRAVTLPTEVQSEKVDATLEHGILTLRIPKAEALQPRSIKVKATEK